ncbi:MAG TPA: hypothetical protein GX740_01010 [Acholeplasmataceae bacterium]|nr:hypothetical protein [Acholeplasmataceae bacterium]
MNFYRILADVMRFMDRPLRPNPPPPPPQYQNMNLNNQNMYNPNMYNLDPYNQMNIYNQQAPLINNPVTFTGSYKDINNYYLSRIKNFLFKEI